MKAKKKKPNPNLPPSRTYLKVWEDKFPWLTKGFGSNGEGETFSICALNNPCMFLCFWDNNENKTFVNKFDYDSFDPTIEILDFF